MHLMFVHKVSECNFPMAHVKRRQRICVKILPAAIAKRNLKELVAFNNYFSHRPPNKKREHNRKDSKMETSKNRVK